MPAGSMLLPDVEVKDCPCAKCVAHKPHRVFHWFCVICGAPGKRARQGFAFDPTESNYREVYRKFFIPPGKSGGGIVHHVCLGPCKTQYLERLGARPRARDLDENDGGAVPAPARVADEPGDERRVPFSPDADM